MTAYNVVRFRVKPGHDEEFVEGHRKIDTNMKGLRSAALVKTGHGTYCFVGEWNGYGDIVGARPTMIGILDRFRDILEDLGGGMGVTDPISGDVVVQLAGGARKSKGTRKAKAAKRKAAKKPARRPAAKKKAAKKPAAKKRRR